MANELVIHYPTGSTLYALLFDATGQVWNGSAFVAPGSASWTDYDIAMTEVATSTGIYRASMPAVAAGTYGWVVRKRAGASPAVSDIAVGSGRIEWNGTAEVSLTTLATAADLATVDTNVDAILEDTGTTLPATLATIDGIVDDILEDIENGVTLATTQPSVKFGQVKITADVEGEGAFHIFNSHPLGVGTYSSGKVGQYNHGTEVGQYNVGNTTGQINAGDTQDVVGVDAAGIRSAVGLATANLDTQLAALPTDAENALAVLAAVYEGSETVQQALRLFRSVLLGKSSNGGATYRDAADSKARVQATLDAGGNRTAVVVDAS